MILLSLETSTNVCSVALNSQDGLMAYAEILIDKSHAEKITFLVGEVCSKASIKLAEIDAVAISKGPGSYTGLRIASSTAKGLCFALDKPLIAIDTLQSMALDVAVNHSSDLQSNNTLLVPMIDARRMEVFTANYDTNAMQVADIQSLVIENNAYELELKNHKMVFFGNGAEKCKEMIRSENASFIDGIYPKASYIGQLAVEKFLKKEFEDLVNFEPFYLKEFYMATKKQVES